jgi:enediyne biosynthesis protein E4
MKVESWPQAIISKVAGYNHSMKCTSIFLTLLFSASSIFSYKTALALPLLSVNNIDTLNAICAGNDPENAISRAQTGVLLYLNNSELIPSEQDELPEEIRANNYSSAGALICLQEVEVELEVCNFPPLFAVPRIRNDYLASAYSVQSPGIAEISATLVGSSPPACSEAGTINSSVKSIPGESPDINQILDFLQDLSVNTFDDDNDGLNNLEEFILASDPQDNSSPGEQIAIYANNTTDLILDEGEALTISISLNPGEFLGNKSDYKVYVDTFAGVFSYFYPAKFKAVSEPEATITASAIRVPNFKLLTIPGIGIGEYQLHFDLDIDNGPLLSSSAGIKVVANEWQFTDVTESAGFNYIHGYEPLASGISRDRQIMAGGVAAGDYDNDGWVDLYISQGSIGANLLFRNLGNGNFSEVGQEANVDLSGAQNSGAVFADFDGDGWLDILVTGINVTQLTLFHNQGDGSFVDVTSESGITGITQSMGAAFADYDKDGDLDIWISHWTANRQDKYLWQNNGDGTFSDVSSNALGNTDGLMADFSTNFADIDNDGWLDILVAGDFGTSQIYHNNHNGSFSLITSDVISDENGMGAAVGDYDNDGDLDWFVTSIYDPIMPRPDFPAITWGDSGNRFYQNQGNGTFVDATDETGTRNGFWGWGSCFSDFNNDGFLDIFHVNGFKEGLLLSTQPFIEDASRLFISDQNGAFLERSVDLGIDDNGQGRGIVCFDYDRDGDVDLFIANNEQAPKLFRNDSGSNNFLHIQVAGELENTQGIGTRIYVTAAGQTQMRELRAGNNYMSQNPVEAYFGLGKASSVDLIQVIWPSGQQAILENVDINQLMFITQP